VGGASFERISDDEERAANGEMFKDARLQERITDAVHAVEFDLEDVPSAAVGSLLSEGMHEGGGFQRIADEEEAATVSRQARQIEAAHVDHFVDDIAPQASRDASFQRVSDDEESQGTHRRLSRVSKNSPAKPEPAGKRRKRTGVIGRLFKSKEAKEDEMRPGNQ
jgi:hypothetical protein